MFLNSPGRKDWAHWIIELNHCVLRDRRSRWGNEKDSWLSCEQKYHRFTFLNFFTFLFWSLTFPQELQSADLFVMITMIIIGCWLLTMMMKHKRKSLPQICCSIIESSGADGSEAIQCSLVPWCTLPCYSGVLDSGTLVYQMGPKGWQRLSPPSPCTTLH